MNHHSTGVWYKQLGPGPEQNGQGVDSPCLLSQACSITVSQVLDISKYHILCDFPLFYTKSTLKYSDTSKYSLPLIILTAICSWVFFLFNWFWGFFLVVFCCCFFFWKGGGASNNVNQQNNATKYEKKIYIICHVIWLLSTLHCFTSKSRGAFIIQWIIFPPIS